MRKKGIGRNELLQLFREIDELVDEARKNRGIWDWTDTNLDLKRIREKWLSKLKENAE